MSWDMTIDLLPRLAISDWREIKGVALAVQLGRFALILTTDARRRSASRPEAKVRGAQIGAFQLILRCLIDHMRKLRLAAIVMTALLRYLYLETATEREERSRSMLSGSRERNSV